MTGKSSNSESAQESMWICIFEVWGHTGGTVQRIIRSAITVGEFQAKWQWVSTLGSSCPPPTPRRRLNSGKTSKHQWDRLNCFSIAEECSALHIHSQTGQGRISCQIHKYNIKCSSLLLCLPQLNIFDPLQDWIQQICRCDNLGETDY